MNRKKAEKIAALVLLGILTTVFFYQVAYGVEVDCQPFTGWNTTKGGPCAFTN